MKLFFAAALALCLLAAGMFCQPAGAAIVATGFFSGTLERFDPVTNEQSTFATIASATDQFPGLAGIAYSPRQNLYYVAGRETSRIYVVDGTSGSLVRTRQLATGSQPAGLTIGPDNRLYIAAIGQNSVLRLNADDSLTSFPLSDPLTDFAGPSGLVFDSSGDLIVSTAVGGRIYRLNTSSGAASVIGVSPSSNAQLAIDSAGIVYAGGAPFTNDVASFNPATGVTGLDFITIDDTLLPPPSFTPSSQFTSPAGVAIDVDGTILVSALGRTNPAEMFDNGGLFRFAADGTFLETIALNSTPFSSVVVATAIPEPGTFAALAVVGVVGLMIRRRRSASGK